MNDYQMTKLSHGHFHELRQEADRRRLAAFALRRPSLARRIIDRVNVAIADADERRVAERATSVQRRDAWQGRANHR